MHVAFGRVRRKIALLRTQGLRSVCYLASENSLAHFQGYLVFGIFAVLWKKSRTGARNQRYEARMGFPAYREESGFGNPSYKKTE